MFQSDGLAALPDGDGVSGGIDTAENKGRSIAMFISNQVAARLGEIGQACVRGCGVFHFFDLGSVGEVAQVHFFRCQTAEIAAAVGSGLPDEV